MTSHPFDESRADTDPDAWSPFEALPDAIAIVNERAVARFTNRAWRELLGAPAYGAPLELAGHSAVGGADPLSGPLRALLAGERERFDEHLRATVNGSARALDIAGRPMRVAGRRGALLRVLVRGDEADSTAELAHFLQAILDAIPVPIFTKDARGAYLRGNVAFEGFLGRRMTEILGKTVYELHPKELADVYHAKDQVLFDRPGVQVYESASVDTSGRRHDIVFHKATFENIDGSLGGLVGAILDITERKAAEDALRLSERRLRELFDHMRQGIVVFGPDALVDATFSRQAAALFGVDDLSGRRIGELLYPERHDVLARAFEEWLAMAFDVPVDAWPELARLAPDDVVLERDGAPSKHLALEFRPIAQDGRVARVMLLATDESEEQRLRRAVQEKELRHARQMAAMRRLVAGGGQVFVGFLANVGRLVTRCEEIVNSSDTLSLADVNELFQRVHTVKSEARAFDLAPLADEAAALEESLAVLRADARRSSGVSIAATRDALKGRLSAMRRAVAEGQDSFVESSPIGRAALEQVTVLRADLEALRAAVGECGDALGRAVERLAARPFGESTAGLVHSVPAWAEREGKRARLEVSGRDVQVPARLAAVLGGVLAHLARNAIAHGIESPWEREALGKPPLGVVRASCVATDAGPLVAVEDDGRGLDREAIVERARELGHTDGARSAEQLVFVPGLSTARAPSDLAGRGAGLDAVRAELEAVGYRVVVESERARGARISLVPTTHEGPMEGWS